MSIIIAGLDIGTTKIACFIGQRAEGGKLKILGHGHTESVGVVRGVVVNIADASHSIALAVQQASKMANVAVEEVYVGIAGQHIRSMSHRGNITIAPEHTLITQEDVDRLVAEQKHIAMLKPGEQIIHTIPQVYYVDDRQLDTEISPVGVSGRKLAADFHMVVCNRENMDNIENSVVLAGLKVKRVVLEPIASSLAVLDETDKEAGAALVDIGGGTTDLAIFHEGIIRHTSVIALAGNVITQDISKGCRIMKDQAELLKVKFGSCMPSLEKANEHVCIPGLRNQPPREIATKTLAEIIKARLDVILGMVSYEIERAGYDKNLLAGIVLTGGGANMKYIDKMSELVCKNHTRIGTPDEHLYEGSDETIKDPMFATAIGLVLFGLEQEEKENHTDAEENNDPFGDDIFKNLIDTPITTSSVDESGSTSNGHPSQSDSKKPSSDDNGSNKGLFNKLGKKLGKIFIDDINDENRD